MEVDLGLLQHDSQDGPTLPSSIHSKIRRFKRIVLVPFHEDASDEPKQMCRWDHLHPSETTEIDDLILQNLCLSSKVGCAFLKKPPTP
eukprot:5436937-Amphidinium_carterae.1